VLPCAGIQCPAELWTHHCRPARHICCSRIWHSTRWNCAIYRT